MQEPPHFSALRKGRLSMSGAVYFITSNVQDRRPILDMPAREIIIESLLWARAQGHIGLIAYVIMDDHFHAVLVLQGEATLANVIDRLECHTARQINKYHGQTGQLWQEGYHDRGIRDEIELWRTVQYVHENPVRRGWVDKPEEYAWSTAYASRKRDMDWDRLGYAALSD